MHFSSVLLVVLLMGYKTKAAGFPKEFERCKRTDLQIDDCLKRAIQNAIPFLVKGVPKAGLQAIDPLVMDTIEMNQNYGPVKFNVTFKDVMTYGYAGMKILNVKSNIDNHEIELSGHFPSVKVKGNYNLAANVLRLPIEGTGSFAIFLDNVNATARIKGEGIKRSGKEYLKIKKIPVSVEIEGIKFDFGNLFGGNTYLGNQANAFLNRFSMDIYRAVRPLYEETMEEIFRSLAQPFYNRVPYTEIYPY